VSDRFPRRLFRLPFRKDRAREEVEGELRFHLEERARRYEREGMTPEQARAAARRRFGDYERVRDEVEETMSKYERAERNAGRMEDLKRDVGFAARQLRRSPGFSAIAILTIALAIGASTAIFSVVDGIMLRSLPYPESDELVRVWADFTRRDVVLADQAREWLSWPDFADFRDEVTAVESISAFGGWNPTLTGADAAAQQLTGATFSHGMFSRVLGVEPAMGRGFLPEEDVPDGPFVVLLSHGLWQRAFGGDPGVLNSTIRLNEQPATVVGIMPADFVAPAFLGTDIWAPLQLDATNGGGRGAIYLRAVGRLADGAAVRTAQQQATQLGVRLEREYPESNRDTGFNVYPLHYDMVQGTSTALWLLLGAVGFVLLIACVNVANLLLARGTRRRSELAVRVAMGAGRQRILAQLVTESLILAAVGGAVGIGLAFMGTDVLVGLAPAGTPLLDQVAVDGRILGFAVLATTAAGLLFGILPAVRASAVQPASSLREGGRSDSGAGGSRLRNVLVVAQIGLALMLLVGAGLLVRSFQNLRSVDMGFDPDGVIAMRIQLPQARYAAPQEEGETDVRAQFFYTLEERLTAIPGVTSVGSITNLPLAGFDGDTNFNVEGAPLPEPGREPSVWLRRVTPNYFDAMGLEIVEGRGFTASEDREAPRVIIINETLARDYFDGNAVGKRLNVNDPEDPIWREVVGVVKDIKNFGIRQDSRNALYLPYAQAPTGFMFTTVRASVAPAALMNPIRETVADLDSGIAVAALQPMTEYVDNALATDRFTTSLLGGFAFLALLLAVVGLYGVVSYAVSTRLREMGVRIALGAESSRIRGLVLRWALALAAGGIVLGAVGALGLSRVIETLLYDVGATDPVTFIGVSVLMVVAALLASLIPALRATRVDPIEVLKTD